MLAIRRIFQKLVNGTIDRFFAAIRPGEFSDSTVEGRCCIAALIAAAGNRKEQVSPISKAGHIGVREIAARHDSIQYASVILATGASKEIAPVLGKARDARL